MKKPNSFVAWFDRVITPNVPAWFVNFCVSAVFALVITVSGMTIFVVAAWDLSWYWSVTSRTIFGTLTAIFWLVLFAVSVA